MARLLLVLSLFSAICGVAPAHAKPIPNLKFHDLAGHDQRFDSLRGSITVITFWATWCAPCRAELPHISRLKERYAASDVHFLAISVDDSKDFAKLQPFLHQQNVSLDVWTGADLDTLDRLHLGNIVPATLVLDKNGEIIGRISGEALDADIVTYLDWLLHDRPGTPPAPFLTRH